ncbi:MAG: glycosyltransferase family 10 [Sedimentitalea sp.]|uniref:glycosyltransferase family 10 domain-containing protein n=1 Tax=Sedimentitalea sp. TaxID=2048915 RepID=UPI003262EBC3
MAEAPSIAILPYGVALGAALAARPADELIWPEGCPERLAGARVGDLLPTDHLIVFPKTSMHFLRNWGTRARVSLIMGEPSFIHSKHIRLLRLTHRRFFRVLTFSQTLLDKIPNAILFPLGGTWVPDWRTRDLTKTRACSLIASAKKDTTGHKLRHAVVDQVRVRGLDVDVMGGGYAPFKDKADGLAPYRYSVVIENMREQNYFSEKLLDAVFCGTVPIYWGCPNLPDFLDPAGLIQCQSEADILAALADMSEADYVARVPQLERLRTQLEPYADIQTRAVTTLREAIAA